MPALTYLPRGGQHHIAAASLVAGKGRHWGGGRAASFSNTARGAVSVGGILGVFRVRDSVNERVEPDHLPSMTGRTERAHPPSPLEHGAACGCPGRLTRRLIHHLIDPRLPGYSSKLETTMMLLSCLFYYTFNFLHNTYTTDKYFFSVSFDLSRRSCNHVILFRILVRYITRGINYFHPHVHARWGFWWRGEWRPPGCSGDAEATGW